jgi:hypothetical protein
MCLDKEARSEKWKIEITEVDKEKNMVKAKIIRKITYGQDYADGIAEPSLKYDEKLKQELSERLKKDKIVSVMIEGNKIVKIEPRDS